MTPNSFAYIVFLVIGALIYYLLPQKAKKPFLLLLNFMFYAIGGVKFLPLLALTADAVDRCLQLLCGAKAGTHRA